MESPRLSLALRPARSPCCRAHSCCHCSTVPAGRAHHPFLCKKISGIQHISMQNNQTKTARLLKRSSPTSQGYGEAKRQTVSARRDNLEEDGVTLPCELPSKAWRFHLLCLLVGISICYFSMPCSSDGAPLTLSGFKGPKHCPHWKNCPSACAHPAPCPQHPAMASIGLHGSFSLTHCSPQPKGKPLLPPSRAFQEHNSELSELGP